MGVAVAGGDDWVRGENGCELGGGGCCVWLAIDLRFFGELPYSGPDKALAGGLWLNGESSCLCGEVVTWAADDDDDAPPPPPPPPPPLCVFGGTQW
jgi:hypothetical protein